MLVEDSPIIVKAVNLNTDCQNVKLVQTGLGHIIITDVIKIRININMSYEEAYSTLTAIINGITEHLQIDRNDIDGVLVKEKEDNRFAFILFDTTYGGAGNVKQLIKLDGLIETLKVAKKTVDNDCCAEDVSCPKCLRNYRNRSFHKYLVRGLAKNMLEEILFFLNKEE